MPITKYSENGGASWIKDPPCWPCCMQTHDHVVMLARELSKQLVREYETTHYVVHGLFGIFASGDPIEYNITGRARLPGQRPWYENYEGIKTKFMFSKLCALSQQRQPQHLHLSPQSLNLAIFIRASARAWRRLRLGSHALHPYPLPLQPPHFRLRASCSAHIRSARQGRVLTSAAQPRPSLVRSLLVP